MNYLIYARVSPKGSSWDGTETSVNTQIAECKAAILAKDPTAKWEIVSDEWATGANTKRPGVQRIISDLENRVASWDCLVIFHLDRLTRSLIDALPIFELIRDQGKGLIAVRQNLDMFTAGGRAMVYMLVIFAQFEREMNSERTKAKMVSIAQGGGIPYGKAPFGYKRNGKGNNVLIPDPAAAAKVKAIFKAYVHEKKSVNDICAALSMAPQSVINVLRNIIYTGMISYGGAEYPGKHEPMISKADFKAAAGILPGKRTATRPKAQKYPYLLTGLLKCGCGKSMVPYSCIPRGKRHHYYRCTDWISCKGNYVPAEKLDSAILASVRECKINNDELKSIVDGYNHAAREYLASAVPELKALEKKDAELIKDRDKIEQIFLNGEINSENKNRWNDRLADVCREIEAVETRMLELSAVKGKQGQEIKASDILDRLKYFSTALESAGDDYNNQRNFLLSKVQSIVSDADGYKLNLVMTKSALWLAGRELVITVKVSI